jgi:hypothetical protein
LLAARRANVVLLEPALDERLFLPGTAGDPPEDPPRDAQEPVRILFTTTDPESEECALLRAVINRLSGRQGAYELDLVLANPNDDYPTYARELRGGRPRWRLAVAPALGAPAQPERYLEYAALGLPGIYSDVEGHRSIERDAGGLVVANDVDAWCASVERLVRDQRLADAIRVRAWTDVVGRRLLLHSSRQLLEAIGRAFALSSGDR